MAAAADSADRTAGPDAAAGMGAAGVVASQPATRFGHRGRARLHSVLRPIRNQHETAPALQHLEELRWRILIVAGMMGVAFAIAFTAREQLFALLNRPIDGRYQIQTLGVTEPFFTAFTVAANTAFVVAIPALVFHCYRFISPALTPPQRRAIRPVLLVAPTLFACGVAFCYFLVLGPAVTFLLGIGDPSFNVTLRAQDYYSFVAMTTLAMGCMFCFPLILFGLGQLGFVTAAKLRANRRIALVLMLVVAAMLPTADPVSLLLETIPLVGLYELSIVLVWLGERRQRRLAQPLS